MRETIPDHPVSEDVWPGDKQTRIGVTGGRDYDDRGTVYATLLALPIGAILVHGACETGLDALAASMWKGMREQDEPHPADWTRDCDANCYHPKRVKHGKNYCPAAGPLRNQEMVDSGLDVLIAFPGGSGTADMVKRAEAANIRVRHIKGE